MQAIRTVKLNATDRSGARVKATAAAGSVTLPWDHSLRHDLEVNHRLAAEALVVKFNWDADGYGTLATGCLPDGSYCHVLTGRDGMGEVKGTFYTLRDSDVGKATIRWAGRVWMVCDFIGQVLPGDVGKRVFRHSGVLQVENDQQRAHRIKGGE